MSSSTLLAEYNRKRDFKKTAEPAGKIAHSEGETRDGRPYRNEYATVFVFAPGSDVVVEAVEYLDTALIETAVFGRDLASGGGR